MKLRFEAVPFSHSRSGEVPGGAKPKCCHSFYMIRSESHSSPEPLRDTRKVRESTKVLPCQTPRCATSLTRYSTARTAPRGSCACVGTTSRPCASSSVT